MLLLRLALKSIGTLTPGKLADFIVYAPGVDLLEGDIRGTRQIRTEIFSPESIRLGQMEDHIFGRKRGLLSVRITILITL